MPKITITTRGGVTRSIESGTGRSLMQVLTDNGFDEVLATCGGNCACATCHVYVADEDLARVGPPASDENDLLDCSDHRQAGSRLSCQIRVTDALDALSVTIAPED